MKNQVFKDRIKYWEIKNPVFNKVFDTQEEIYKLIEFVDQLIEIYTNVSAAEVLNEIDLSNFIDGLTLLPLIKIGDTDSPAAAKSKKLTDPVLKHLRKIYSSDSWRSYIINMEVSGDEVLEINGLKVPISVEQVKLHIERLNKYPMQRGHIAEIQADLVDYKKKQYATRRPSKIIKTSILKALFKEFEGDVFTAEKADFINAINEPLKYGHLIHPITRKTTYLYYLLGYISGFISNPSEWNMQICQALGFDITTYYKKKSGPELPDDFTKRFKSISF